MLETLDDLVSSEVLAGNPTLALYRGMVACNSRSEVRVTFDQGRVHAIVDQGPDEASVYMEPAYEHDQGLPVNLYIGYLSSHVWIPLRAHTNPDEGGSASDPKASSLFDPVPQMQRSGQSRALPCRTIKFNVYYDNANLVPSTAHFSNMDATFKSVLGVRLSKISYTYVNTNGYPWPSLTINPDPFLSNFWSHTADPAAPVDAALLITDNWFNIWYGDVLGMAYVGHGSLAPRMFCYVVKSFASDHQVRAVGCQEISPRISQMTLAAAYNEVTISPMNTGENEPQAVKIRRIQWVKHARRRCESISTAGSSWNSTAQTSPLMRA